MKMVNVMRSLTVVVGLTVLLAARAEGAVLSIVPDALAVKVGDPIVLDLMVDLAADEAVGGAAVRLTFDPTILTGVGFVLDPDGKMGVAFDASAFGPDFLDLLFVADFLPSELKTRQGSGFRLAEISLLAIGPGTSPISFVDWFGGYLSDASGDGILPATTRDGSIVVPEPAVLSLVVAGLVAAATRGRLRRRH